MANRAYLYSANEDFTQIRDLSESRYPIPFFYKIVMGEDTSICESQIWDYPQPIAIKANFEKGFNKLLALFDYLQTQKELDSAAIAQYRKETTDFFEREKGRIHTYFFLEGSEIFELLGEPIELLNSDLYNDILAISAQVNDILANKPLDVFAFSEAAWLHAMKKDVSFLSVYWTHVTYISFNRT